MPIFSFLRERLIEMLCIEEYPRLAGCKAAAEKYGFLKDYWFTRILKFCCVLNLKYLYSSRETKISVVPRRLQIFILQISIIFYLFIIPSNLKLAHFHEA